MNTVTSHLHLQQGTALSNGAVGERGIPSQRDRESLIAKAACVAEVLTEEAAASDEQRRLTHRAITAVTEAGLMRLFTPCRHGGYEARPGTLFEVCIELGRGCCSASWVTSVLNMGNYMAAQLPPASQDEIWNGNPDTRTALVIVASNASVDRVDEGIIVTGEWAYASGCLHCEWVAALVPKGVEPGDDTTNLVFIRAGEMRINDTWHVTGMRGTGSNTVVAKRLFIPRHRVIPYAPIVTGKARGQSSLQNLFRSSFSGLLSLGLLGPQIGAIETALRLVREHAHDRRVASSTFCSQAQSPAFQTALAEASMLIDGARLHAHRIAESVQEHARLDVLPDEMSRTRTRMEAAHVARACREAIDRLITAYGSSAFAESNPLQRIWRDLNVASRHAGFGMDIPQLVYGRSLVGLDPREVSYLV